MPLHSSTTMASKRPRSPTDPEDMPAPKRPSRKAPLTTNEKVAAAEAIEKKAAAAAAKKKSSKPRALPPPGEIFQTRKIEAATKLAKSKAPLTTKGKIRAAAVKQKNDEEMERKRQVEKAAREKAKVAKSGKSAQGLSLYGAVMTYDESTLQYVSKGSSSAEKVTERPTARTKLMQARRSQTERIRAQVEDAARSLTVTGTTPRLTVMDLPKELRCQIWELCVVYQNCFIFPNTNTGKEQPDLAMTCRVIRAEVLPIYYAKNTFAIDTSASAKKPCADPEAVLKWVDCLEKMQWSSMIRKWAFSYTSIGTIFGASKQKVEEASFVISLIFTDQQRELGRRSWDACVEVHRDASCMLPAMEQYGQCVIQMTPKWLQSAVIDVINGANGGAIRGNAIVELAKAVESNAKSLMVAKCERVVSSIEVGYRAGVFR